MYIIMSGAHVEGSWKPACLAESWELLAIRANLNEFTTVWGEEMVSISASPVICTLEWA